MVEGGHNLRKAPNPQPLLKQCRTALSKPLYMRRKSLDTREIPLILKTENVVPVHKGGIPKNYRPITFTSHLIKVFKKVLREHIVTNMERHGLFNPSQHGFYLGRSCLSQLIGHYNHILELLANGVHVDVICINPSQHGFYLGRSCLSQLIGHYNHILELLANGVHVDVICINFANALEKVDFMMTVKKLKGLGISGKVRKWFHSFLTKWSQVVLVWKARSQPMAVKSGVPQDLYWAHCCFW